MDFGFWIVGLRRSVGAKKTVVAEFTLRWESSFRSCSEEKISLSLRREEIWVILTPV